MTLASADILRLGNDIAHYVGRTLHVPTTVEPCAAPANLPAFIGRSYRFFEAKIAQRKCLLMVSTNEVSPGDITKQVRVVENETEGTVIVAFSALSARDRSRLISHGVSFIVAGNQFYVPELGMDLREHFKARRSRPTEGLSPAAQAVLFHHVLRRNESATTPSELAQDLRYSAMSIGRAFDDLEADGLAETEKRGRERHLRFRESREDLFGAARTLLRTPVKSQKLVSGQPPKIMLGGESALATLTALGPPKLDVYVMLATDWKEFAAQHPHGDDDYDADFVVETWSYDPAGLSDGVIADPLSLYAQFWNHEDERVAMAAEELLERVPW